MATTHEPAPDVPATPDRAEPTTDLIPPLSGAGAFGYEEAAVLVWIAAFVGLAIAWGTGGMAPWAGAVIGGGLAYLGGALVLACRG